MTRLLRERRKLVSCSPAVGDRQGGGSKLGIRRGRHGRGIIPARGSAATSLKQCSQLANIAPLLLQLATIMAVDPLSESEKAAKGALFSRLVEALPALLALRPVQGSALAQGLAPVLDALETTRALAAGPNVTHQNLFRYFVLQN